MSDPAAQQTHPKLGWRTRAAWGSFGALLPMAIRLSGERHVYERIASLGAVGVLDVAFPLILYLFAGAAVAAAFEGERIPLKLLILGMTAPALITSWGGYNLAAQAAGTAHEITSSQVESARPNSSVPTSAVQDRSENSRIVFQTVYAQTEDLRTFAHSENSAVEKLKAALTGTSPNRDYFVITSCHASQTVAETLVKESQTIASPSHLYVYKAPDNYSPAVYCVVWLPNASFDEASAALTGAAASGWQNAYIWTFGLPLRSSDSASEVRRPQLDPRNGLRKEKREKKVVPSATMVIDFSFDPAGLHVAVAHEDGSGEILETLTTSRKALKLSAASPIIAVHFQPESGSLAALLKSGNVVFFSPTTGTLREDHIKRVSLADVRIESGGFSLAGGLLATRVGDSVDIWNLSTGKYMDECPRGAAGLIWDQDDQRVACVGKDGGATIIDLKHKTKHAKIGYPRLLLDGSFSADGNQVAFATGARAVPLFTPTGMKTSSLEFKSGIDAVSFHPSGNLIAAASSDGIAYLRDLRSGQTSGITTGAKKPTSVRFSRDGRWLAILKSSKDLEWFPMRSDDLQALSVGSNQ